ncbi:MAG: alginate export family protein [Gemmatimonadetes bacterium]|nr:alginate export family protein [Gemmatimonadota bacterium]
MTTTTTRIVRRTPLAAYALYALCALLGAIPAHLAAQTTAPAAVPVTFFGEIRARSEMDRPGGGLPTDVFTYLRTRIGIRAQPADGVRLLFQLQDSRVYGANTAVAAASIFDLHQGYVDFSATWRDADVTTRVGRQEVALGNERLVGAVNWSNTGRTFDAARVLFSPRSAASGAAEWTATAFVATVDERGRRFGATPAADDLEPADRALVGAYATRKIDDGTLHATLLFDAGANYRSYSSSNRFTADARYVSNTAARFGVDIEGAYQAGTQHYRASGTSTTSSQDVGAWLLAARAGVFPSAGRRTSAIVGADILSGDATSVDGRYTAFATLYATNHSKYGLMDLFGDPAGRTKERGLVDALGMVSRELNSRTTLQAELHRYNTQAGDTREIGWELDVVAPVRLSGGASLQFGYGAFRAGPGAAAIGLGAEGSSRHWAFAMVRAAF